VIQAAAQDQIVRILLDSWRARLLIAERVELEFIADDGQTDRELEARTELRAFVEPDGSNRWSWVMSIVEPYDPEAMERTIVHELVHILLEPLRTAYLAAKSTWLITTDNPGAVIAASSRVNDLAGKLIVMPPETGLKQIISEGSLETWETVIERIADAYLAAYR
jgi:hypothetical protein